MTAWQDLVPELTDSVVRLRAHRAADTPAIVEQSRDAATIRWTTIPTPAGGYSTADAEFFINEVVAPGWRDANQVGKPTTLSWAISADRGGPSDYCGSIDLRLAEDRASVGYVLHPDARGRGFMRRALRLVLAYGFAQGVPQIWWQAFVGNTASWRPAAAVGFVCQGVAPNGLEQRGRWMDAWQAVVSPSSFAASPESAPN